MTTTQTPAAVSSSSRGFSGPMKVIIYVWLIFISAATIFPVIYALLGAFTPTEEINAGFSNLLFGSWTFENVQNAWEQSNITSQLLNSVIVTVCQTAAQFITALLASYALVFGRLRITKVMAVLFMIPMFLPGEVNILGNFLTVRAMGLYDTVPAIFIPYLANALTIFLFVQAFRSFPPEIREAAQMDGVGPLRFLFKFLVPLNRAVCMTALLNCAIAAWNGYMWPLLITMSDTVRTIQPGVKALSSENGNDTGMVLAGLLIASIPMLLLVLFGQRYLSRGLTEGAVK